MMRIELSREKAEALRDRLTRTAESRIFANTRR